ncbi:MAG: TonB-dependent receptor [Rhodospirillaceae bacterium]|nr:TonB-dependent receptor [Rhodospirillaceae bacterium]
MLRQHWLSTAAVGVLTSALAGNALAQVQLEEIVVTARKTEERLQDVPISVTAFSAKELSERGLTDVFKVATFTPGFSFEKTNRYGAQGGTSRPVIRGQSNILGEGNAAIFVDGILFTDNILSFPFDLVERVETIKGPQAALFGRATFAGAINLITKKGTNNFENKVSVRAAEYDDYEVNLMSRGPVVEDKVFYMLHGRYYDFAGQYRNTLDGKKVGGEESKGINGALEFNLTDNLTASVSMGYNEDDDDLAAIGLQDRFSNNCFLNRPRQYYCGEVKRLNSVTIDRAGLQGKEGVHRDSTRLFGSITYENDDITITSNTGLFWTNTEYGYDSTFQGGTAFGLTTVPGTTVARAATDPIRIQSTLRNEVTNRDEWSQEVRASSAQDKPIRGLMGVFYYQRRRALEERHFAATAPTIDFGTDRVDNKAVFASLTGDFTDQLTGSVELRYAEDKIGNFKRTVTLAGVTRTDVLIENNFKSWSPRFTLDYKPTEDTLIYGVIAKGNKPGAINADPRFPPDIQFAKEESSWNYEIGTKNNFLNNTVALNLAAYYVDWTNQQLTTTFVFPTGGTQSYLINAAKSRVKGFEATVSAVLTDYFTASASYGLNDAKFKELNDPEANELFGNPSVAGKRTPNAPKHQATLSGKFTYPVADDVNGFFRSDFAYTGRKFDQVYNLAHTGEQYLLNLKLGVENDAWNFTLFVDNLTDDRSVSTIVRYVDQMNLNVAPNANPALNNVAGTTTQERAFQYPLADKRRFGVTASYKF